MAAVSASLTALQSTTFPSLKKPLLLSSRRSICAAARPTPPKSVVAASATTMIEPTTTGAVPPLVTVENRDDATTYGRQYFPLAAVFGQIEMMVPAMSACSCFSVPIPIFSELSVTVELPPSQRQVYCEERKQRRLAIKTSSIWPSLSAAAIAVGSLVAVDAADAFPMENLLDGAKVSSLLADINLGDWLGGLLYSAGQQANEAVQDQLSAPSFTSLAVIFSAGLVTSLSPCTLSVLPLTLGYIGAFGFGKSRMEVFGHSVAFSLGLATTLAILGIAAAFAGKAYGQIGQGLPLAASGLAVIMGLSLLEIVELQLPSFFNNFDPRAAAASFPSGVQAYLAGLTFALAASPCSTPVLASLLGYVATSRDPLIGGTLLLTYTTGYIAPLLVAASFAGALQSLLAFRRFSAWINPVSGALLLSGGIYTLLDKLFPATSMVM